MKIGDKVLKTVEENRMIVPGDRVAVALSGGKDSVCLLFLLSSARERLGITLSAVHVHHGLRAAADADEAFVRDLCARLSVPLQVFHVDTPAFAAAEGLSVEEAARTLRYRAFEEVDADRIALAHHKDDQAETVLLHLIRGSSLRGLGGMRFVRGRYIRPMLEVSSAEIETFLAEEHIAHREDETNADLSYARNRVRRELMPYLKEHFSEGITETLCRNARLMQEDEEYLGDLARKAYADMGEVLLCGAFARLPRPLRTRVIRLALEKEQEMYRVSEKHVALAERLALSEKDSGFVSLSDGLTMARKSGIIYLYSTVDFERLAETERNGKIGAVPLSVPGCAVLPDGREIHAEITSSPGKAALLTAGADEKWGSFSAEGLCVRSRAEGDRIAIFDSNRSLCRKSLQDYFVDAGVPAEERDRIPLVTRGSEVLWIVGHRLSDACRIPDPDDPAEPVIHLYYKKP